MSVIRRVATLTALATLAACGADLALVDGRPAPAGPSCYGMTSLPWAQPQIGLTSVRIAGTERQLPGLFPSATKDADIAAAVADQAALDWSCPLPSVHVAARPTSDFAWGVEACGHRGAYVGIERDVTTSGATGHEGRCLVMETVRLVRLDRDAETAIRRMDETYSGPQPAAGSEEGVFASTENLSRVRSWGALVDQASKDLACPRDEVLPGFWVRGRTTNPVAEGCGQRATYLPGVTPPFMMQSLVRVTSP